MSLRFGFFGRAAAIWVSNGCFSIGFWVNPIGATHSQRRKTLRSHPLNSSVVAGKGWHTVWAKQVCPRKQGVFDVHK